MTFREGACSCGNLRIRVQGDPVRISVCHCLACQRRTGSAFSAQARFVAEQAEVTGQATQYVRRGDSGGIITQHFCPDCGATVFYQIDSAPELVAVPIGGFADPAFPAPTVSVYETRMHAWVRLPDGIAHDP